MKIGFIGLGNMGGPMAANLVKGGHQVAGFDLTAPMPEGVTKAATAAEAATDADVVLTMLPNGAILRAVAAEVIPAMRKGAILCDCSTVDVDSARAVAELADAAGLGALDAPVSGGIGGASAGMLTFMVGGTAAAFARLGGVARGTCVSSRPGVPKRPVRSTRRAPSLRGRRGRPKCGK